MDREAIVKKQTQANADFTAKRAETDGYITKAQEGEDELKRLQGVYRGLQDLLDEIDAISQEATTIKAIPKKEAKNG